MPSDNTPQTNEEAMVAETHAHYKKMMLLADPQFHEGNRIGLAQERAGDTVSLEELRRKYGRH
jgi:hypothetical protein